MKSTEKTIASPNVLCRATITLVTAPARGSRSIELEILTTAGGRKALTGFFLSGMLLSFLGAILPAWGFYLHSDFSTAATS